MIIPNELLALAPTGGHTGFLDNLSFQIAGLVVVVASLGILAAIVSTIGRLLALHAGEPAPPHQLPLSSDDAEELPAETLAIIASAVSAVLHGPHRILQIRSETDPHIQAWSLEGRRQIFESHHIR